MRIVFADTTLSGSLIGGAQIFLPKLVKGLIQRGHEVYIVAKGEANPKIKAEIEQSGTFFYVHKTSRGLLPEEQAKNLAEWVNQQQPEAYVVSVSPDIGWLALPHLDTSISTFCIGHTDAPVFYEPAAHYRPLLSAAIGVSDAVCEHYIQKDGFAEQQVEWIPYGAECSDTPPLTSESDNIKLIYVGRMDEAQKRVSDLAAVAKELSAKKIPYHLTVVGDGPEMPVFKEKLNREITNGTVKLPGWLSPAEVREQLRQSEIFLLTSAFEGFCIALTEAMANGCCPVVTNIRSGNKQLIVHDESGYLLPIGDTAAFVDVLSRLQQDRAKLSSKRIAAWQSGKRYSIERMVSAYETVFVAAVAKNRKRPRLFLPDFPIMKSCRSKYPAWMRKIKKQLFY